jgi:hypothetical protein
MEKRCKILLARPRAVIPRHSFGQLRQLGGSCRGAQIENVFIGRGARNIELWMCPTKSAPHQSIT